MLILGSVWILFAAFREADAQMGSITADGCFTEYLDTKVMCLTPFEVCPDVQTCDDCRKICREKPGCVATQYQISTKQCSLYNRTASAGIGFKPPPPVGLKPPTSSSHRVRRQNQPGCYGNSPPSLNRNSPDFTYSETTNKPGCCAGSATGGPAPPTIPDPQPTAPTPILPPEATCPSNQVLLYYQYQNYQLAGVPVNQFNAISEQACVQACTDNKLADGTVAPCQSADFNNQNNACQFFLAASPPIGSGQINPTPGVNHFEKTCQDPSLTQNCKGPIVMTPQKLLVGYVESVATTSNQQDCIAQCLNSEKLFGFPCKSGMFYSKETKDNCILNRESAQSHPDLFVDESTDSVNYFEPSCAGIGFDIRNLRRPKRQAGFPDPPRRRSVIWVNRPGWGSWSRCDGKTSRRSHYRNCRTFNPNKCETAAESCDPKDRAKEQREIDEEEKAPVTTRTTPALPTAPPNPDTPSGGGDVTENILIVNGENADFRGKGKGLGKGHEKGKGKGNGNKGGGKKDKSGGDKHGPHR